MKSLGKLLAAVVAVLLICKNALGQIPRCHLFDYSYKTAMRTSTNRDNFTETNGQWVLSSWNNPDFLVPPTGYDDYYWLNHFISELNGTLYIRPTVGVSQKTNFSFDLFMEKPFANVSVYFNKMNDDVQNDYNYLEHKIATFTPDMAHNYPNWETLSGDCTTADGKYCCGTNASETCSGQFVLSFERPPLSECQQPIAIASFRINDGNCTNEEDTLTDTATIVVLPKSASVIRGQKHRLTCQFDSGLFMCFKKSDKIESEAPYCFPYSSPNFIFQQCSWMKDGQWIPPMGDHYSFDPRGVDGDCSLTIKSVDPDLDAGSWQCITSGLHSPLPAVASEPALLKVVTVPEDDDYVEITSASTTAFSLGNTTESNDWVQQILQFLNLAITESPEKSQLSDSSPFVNEDTTRTTAGQNTGPKNRLDE